MTEINLPRSLFSASGNETTNALLALFNWSGSYKADLSDSNFVIRRNEDCSLSHGIEQIASISKTNPSDIAVTAAIERYKAGSWGQERENYEFNVPKNDILTRFSKLPSENPNLKDWQVL